MVLVSRFILEVEKEPLEIAKRTEKLYLDGLNYRAALRQAKEEFSKRKEWNVDEILQRES